MSATDTAVCNAGPAVSPASGPKGTRTPDLLAARYPGPTAVLTCVVAGNARPKQALLSAEEEGAHGRPDRLGRVVPRGGCDREKQRDVAAGDAHRLRSNRPELRPVRRSL